MEDKSGQQTQGADLNNTKETPESSNKSKKTLVIIISIISLLIIGGVSAAYYFNLFSARTQLQTIREDLFSGFSKLALSGAHAQDNFELNAVEADSLGVEPSSTYVLTSKESVETGELKKSITVSPDVNFDLNKKSDKEWELELDDALTPNTIFKIALAATVIDESGDEQVRDYEWAFQVKDTFKVLHYIPRDTATNVPTNSGIEVTFSHENFTSYESYFNIEPHVDGRFEKHGRTLVYVPTRLKDGTVYTVTMKKGLPLSESNDKFEEDFSFSFETRLATQSSRSNSWFRIYEKLQDVNSTEPPLIHLSSRNIAGNTLDVSIFSLNGEAEYLEMLSRRDSLPWWSYSKDYHLTETDSRQALTSFQVQIEEDGGAQFIRFPENLPTGYFLVDVTKNGMRDQLWLQVTDAAAYVNVATNETVIWAADLENKQPVSGAQIELIGTGKKYTTNGEGIAVFNTPEVLLNASTEKKNNKRHYFKVSFSGKELIIPALHPSRSYGSYSKSEATDYWRYLYSDRPLYQPTDNIKIWGLLKRRDDGKINKDVTVTLFKQGYVDYYYRPVVIQEKNIKVDNLGTFTDEMEIKDLRPDSYSLELKVGDDVIVRKYIQVRPYDKPAYQLSLVPDKKIAFAGDDINMEAKATFFEGTPVPDLSLVFETPKGKETVVTNDEGIVNLSYSKDYFNCNQTYRCWPKYEWLKLSPELSEIAEIQANAGLRFYGPEVLASSKVTYPSTGKARLEVTSSKIDLTKIEDSYWVPKDALTDPSVGTKVEGKVTKITYSRNETGTKYNFINKRTYKTYSYTRNEEEVGSFDGVTDGNGQYVYEQDVEPETSYRIQIKYFDEKGRYDNIAASFYYYDGTRINRYGGSGTNLYRIKLPEDNSFSVGEGVEVDFVNSDESLPDNGDNHFLFMQYQNGYQEHTVTQNSEYKFNFENRDIPNVNLFGVYFNGKTFIIAQTGYVGNSIKFDTDDKTLQIDVTPDKSNYEPGEKVNLSISTRDSSNRPISASVNLNLIDEAFYAVLDSQASPISSIFTGVGSGSIFSIASHRLPANLFGGAEKGGCFLAGTEILMADGSKKVIEEIEIGDEILTLEDARSSKKSAGTVTELYKHIVSEYLIINNELEVTPEHLVYANLGFQPAGDLEIGDWMLDEDGSKTVVTSIEVKREVIPVFNFRVDPQHTYFANGYYVHNEKGGGPREFFTDAALFQTVTTNNSGFAQTSFTLPDNVTSWRVTAQGLSSRLDVGVSLSKIPVSLPVFLETTIGKEYVTGDEPVARLRSFGTALTRSDAITLSLASEDLGITEPMSRQSTAFQSEFFPLQKLEEGVYDISYALDSQKGNDAIKLPMTVLDSQLTVQSTESYDANSGSTITNTTNRPMAVLISDKRRSEIYNTLRRLSWSWGDRVDQALARKESRKLLKEAFDSQRHFYNFTEFTASLYQTNTGGITLLPYSSEDLELTARIADLDVVGFDENSMAQYFFKKLEDKNSNKEEISLALYGLASLDQPVLQRLYAWLERDDLTVKEKLYSALAAYSLGDGERARSIYLDVVKEHGQIKEPHIILKAGNTNDEILNNTALAAVLAVRLNADEQHGLRGYLNFNKPKEILINLEDLSFAKASLKNVTTKETEIDIEVNQEKSTANLKSPRFTHSLELQPGQSIRVLSNNPDIVITTYTPIPFSDSDLTKDDDILISREYFVNGKKTNTFKETDLVEVRITPQFNYSALDGNYQITDLLPSGLLPVTKLYRGGKRYDCKFWYPYNREGQKVKYIINKNWKSSYCGGSFIRYYARVKTKGTYVAEPVVIQSTLNPDLINFSSEDTVVIE